MTKQEFLQGRQFRLPYPYSDEVLRFNNERVSRDCPGSIERLRTAHCSVTGFDSHGGNVMHITARSVKVYKYWLGKQCTVVLKFSDLHAEPVKDSTD